MNVSSRKINDKMILKFEIDRLLGYEANDFQEAILEALNYNCKCIVVDLSLINFISSWGIGMLIHGLTTAKNRDVEFKIACVNERILQIFAKIKIDTVLDIYPSIDSALN